MMQLVQRLLLLFLKATHSSVYYYLWWLYSGQALNFSGNKLQMPFMGKWELKLEGRII